MIRFRNISIIFVISLLLVYSGKELKAQNSLKIMYYNVLNYPGSSPDRVTYFRTINQYTNADIILVNEMISDEGAIMLLENGLNVYGDAYYKKADFTNGPDSDNMLFYDSTKVTLLSQATIQTELRHINEYILYYNDLSVDTSFFYMYSAHLKSSSGSSNEQKRLAEVREFKEWIDNKPEAENVFFGGDFNFYDSNEPAYDTLINFGVLQLNDPLLSGDWHDNVSYASIHSQSTRTDQFGGGASGGLDDRFDFILFSDDIKDGLNGAMYIPNSCVAIGNDGNHLNTSIIGTPTNNSVPDSVLQALYNMSDHLPIICEIEMTVETFQKEINNSDLIVDIYPNPTTGLLYINGADNAKLNIYNTTGLLVATYSNFSGDNINISDLGTGIYFIKVFSHDQVFTSKLVIE